MMGKFTLREHLAGLRNNDQLLLMLRPIRNLLPSMGGIDFSPMILVLLLYVVNMGIAELLQATGNVLLPGLWMAL
jgi:YggT family protein